MKILLVTSIITSIAILNIAQNPSYTKYMDNLQVLQCFFMTIRPDDPNSICLKSFLNYGNHFKLTHVTKIMKYENDKSLLEF